MELQSEEAEMELRGEAEGEFELEEAGVAT